ncbi:hypothetical protein [Pseudomonas segetis]|uniref:Uncharacterized lipoprotein YbaY n=1 Tax=Pseudomonas segetis TaxID=298908 RepID=A0A239H797_9PSED|nr:hypothetical protein [Pseudomonas segetis]SNS77306.1 Uncharacterized lipoprotein YbaY [Pseudomonas segetis]
MYLRHLTLIGLLGLLSACASDPAAPVASQPETKTAAATAATPAHLREISGNLIGVPDGAMAEVALLVIGSNGLPAQLLGNIQLRGNGSTLPFRLVFNPAAFDHGIRVELRGRANLEGRLIQHMPTQLIRSAQNQTLGDIRMQVAP